MRKPSPIHLFILTMLLSALLGTTPSEAVQPSVGEWSSDCNPAFRIAAMPTTWDFHPAQGPLQINARLAIDHEMLPAEDWELVSKENPDESFTRLIGYRDMLLEAQVFELNGVEPVARLDGRYSTDNGSMATVFYWDGRDQAGNLLKPGRYEIQVRGRFIPVSLDINAAQLSYRDLDEWNGVAEACTRTLRVNLTDTEQTLPTASSRSAMCPSPPPLPSDYYDTVVTTDGASLRSTLHDVIDDHTRFPYSDTGTDTWDILNDADENPSNSSQVLTVYMNEAHNDGCSSGCAWNREHSWAKSYGFSEDSGAGRTPYTDCHQLRACNAGYNSTRGNLPFNDCPDTCSTYGTFLNDGFGGGAEDVNQKSGSTIGCTDTPPSPDTDDLWEVWPHRKGDIARAMFYMDVRYAGDSGIYGSEQDLILTDNLALMVVETTACGDGFQDPAYFGILSTLIDWHYADPVDTDEMRRNEQVWCQQGNRNPFVDHPEYVACLFEGDCSGPSFSGITAATDLDPCDTTGVKIDWAEPSDWADGCSDACRRTFYVKRDGTLLTTGGCGGGLGERDTTCTDNTGTPAVIYTYSVTAENDIGETSDGSSALDEADGTSDGTIPTITIGPTNTPLVTEIDVEWTTDEQSDSYIEWGTASGDRPNSTYDASLVAFHTLSATNLDPETEYFFVVCSTDVCGNGPRCSDEGNATTLGDPGESQIFVNELHYDNASTDVNEGVEVAGTAGADLTGWSITFYNGSGGAPSTTTDPNPLTLSGTIPDEGGGMGAIWFDVLGIQNGGYLGTGAADGLALVDDTNTVVQYLCYEGTFTAVGGPADGLTCTDIGVSEDPAPAATESVQLTGTGCAAADFTWTGPTTNSHDALNTGQVADCGTVVPEIFDDGFEDGTTDAWTQIVP